MNETVRELSVKKEKLWDIDIGRGNFLFYFSYTIWFGMNILVDSAYESFAYFPSIFEMTNMICLVLIGIHLLRNKFTVSKLPMLLLCGVCVLISAVNTGLFRIIFTILFMIAAGNQKWKDLIKLSFAVECVLMIFILLSYLNGILPNETILRMDSSPRYYLGYNYTTLSANYFFHMVLMYLYIKKGKMKVFPYVAIILINIFFYLTTNTKTIFAMVFLVLGAVFFTERISSKWMECAKIRKFLHYVFFIFGFISIEAILAFRWESWIFSKINSIMTNRLSLGQQAYDQYGISILGQMITWNTEFDGPDPYMYVDCAYMNVAINYGIVILALLCAGFTYMMGRALKEKDAMLLICGFFLAAHSISDPQLYMAWYNPFLLLIGAYFYKDGEESDVFWKVKDTCRTLKQAVILWQRKRKQYNEK